MDVSIKGKGNFSLNKSDFVASGGEGKIYRKGDVAFKIYSDPSKMIPIDKIAELSVLSMPNIIRPESVVLSKGNPVGYTMKYLNDTYAMCQLFTRAFRDRMAVSPDDVIRLVGKFRRIPEHCHENGVLIVDLNEMNFLVDDSFKDVFAIDCDSYQTKSFPATAIMESIRDRHSSHFSQGSDWFSFGIVTFQMFIGIHPFKGKHPKYKTLDERMGNNISVLNKAVSTPAVCYPISNIPQAWLDWYRAIFEDGKREAPPEDMRSVAVVARRARITGSNNFVMRKLVVAPADVIAFTHTPETYMTADGLYEGICTKPSLSFAGRWDKKLPAVGQTPTGTTIAAWAVGGALDLQDVRRGVPVAISAKAEAVMAYGGRIYFKSDDRMLELELLEVGATAFATPRLACQVLANATKMFDGVVMQDVLGACYAAFFPRAKACYQVHLKELDGHRILAARFDGGALMVVTHHKGAYHKFILRMAQDFSSYDCREEPDASPASTINFVCLPTGVVVHLNDKEELELFSNAPNSSSIKIFSDPALSGEMRLSRQGTQVIFYREDEMYSMEVKKP